jgi:hypothetical protein
MKTKLIILTAVAALSLASPAVAQSFDPEIGTGNVKSFGYQPFQGQGFEGRRLYNYAPTYGAGQQRAPLEDRWSTSPEDRWSDSPSVGGAIGGIGH